MQPKVSIITVCFNSSKTINDTIESVLKQDYPNIEYIILDGKSTDDTVEIIKKYSKEVAIIQSEKDNGMYDAINKGIQLATGSIIGVLNSDDFYVYNSVITDVVEKMETERTDALYADLYYVGAIDTNVIKRYWRSGKYREGKFLSGWMPPHPTFFVKKSLYKKYGAFNLSLVSAADYELMLRLIHKHKIKLSYLPKVIVKMREGGISNVSIWNRLRANREDRRAWILNDLKPTPFTILLKPIRKVLQFIRK